MSASTEEVTVDLAALDAAEAKKHEKKAEKTTGDPEVIVDSEISSKKGAEQALSPEQGLDKLRKELKDEREARAAAETRAREAEQAEAAARGRAQTSELDLVKNALASMTQANDALEAKYVDALAAQDWAAAAKINRQMGENSAKIAQLESGRAALERQPKPVARAAPDPVEAFCAGLSPASAAWVRAHGEFVRDPSKQKQMIAAHEIAIARGHRADTDAYFRSIEKTLDVDAPAVTNGGGAHEADPLHDPSATVATGGRQSAPAAAPVSRSGAGPNGSRPNVVRLTAEEVEIAENLGMTNEEYARNKVALKKEGKLQ
jgi:hypothetical protein